MFAHFDSTDEWRGATSNQLRILFLLIAKSPRRSLGSGNPCDQFQLFRRLIRLLSPPDDITVPVKKRVGVNKWFFCRLSAASTSNSPTARSNEARFESTFPWNKWFNRTIRPIVWASWYQAERWVMPILQCNQLNAVPILFRRNRHSTIAFLEF